MLKKLKRTKFSLAQVSLFNTYVKFGHKCKLQVWPNLEGLPLAHLRSNSFNLLLYLPKFNLGGVTLELPLVLSLFVHHTVCHGHNA